MVQIQTQIQSTDSHSSHDEGRKPWQESQISFLHLITFLWTLPVIYHESLRCTLRHACLYVNTRLATFCRAVPYPFCKTFCLSGGIPSKEVLLNENKAEKSLYFILRDILDEERKSTADHKRWRREVTLTKRSHLLISRFWKPTEQ